MTCDAHFRTWPSYSSQKSHVKIWFGLGEPFRSYHLKFPWGRYSLLDGLHVTLNAHLRTWPIYSSKKSCVEIWFGLVERFKSYHGNKQFSGGRKHPIRGVTFDLLCPFSNSDELFQSKVMCENLVRIGWAFQELSFDLTIGEGGGGGGETPLLGWVHVTCNAHFRNWQSYSSQKSCVKIWFGLVKPFQSYRVHKHFFQGAETPYLWWWWWW